MMALLIPPAVVLYSIPPLLLAILGGRLSARFRVRPAIEPSPDPEAR